MTDQTKHNRLHIVETVSNADRSSSPYIGVPFHVPEGATRLDLRLEYPKSETCIVDLGLGNPDLMPFPSERGLVGWSGGARSHVHVASNEATPGYRAGMAHGDWTVILGLYRLPDEPVEIHLHIAFDFEPRPAATPRDPPRVARPQAGWYRGDLQCHTFHSDAKGSPEMLRATALREGLDFLAVTDHNTTTAHAAYFDGASSAELIFLPAYEFTTDRGHANVFGAREVFDFRATCDEDVLGMAARIRAQGHLFSVNHDKPDIPWTYSMPDADCMEVWQAPWLAGNHVSLARYQTRLAEGRRLTAIGGSDFHQPANDDTGNLQTLGRPCTFLYCDELSIDGILEAMRKGRSFVTEAPDGPRLVIDTGGAGHGATIAAGDTIDVTYSATGARGDVVEFWDATGRIAAARLADDETQQTVSLASPSGFIRAQIVAEASRDRIIAAARAHVASGKGGRMDWQGSWEKPVLRALTSPIYLI